MLEKHFAQKCFDKHAYVFRALQRPLKQLPISKIESKCCYQCYSKKLRENYYWCKLLLMHGDITGALATN